MLRLRFLKVFKFTTNNIRVCVGQFAIDFESAVHIACGRARNFHIWRRATPRLSFILRSYYEALSWNRFGACGAVGVERGEERCCCSTLLRAASLRNASYCKSGLQKIDVRLALLLTALLSIACLPTGWITSRRSMLSNTIRFDSRYDTIRYVSHSRQLQL